MTLSQLASLSARGTGAADTLHAFAPEYMRHRADQRLDVAPQGPIGPIEVVHLRHLMQRHARGAQDLPVAGHAGRHLETPPLPTLDLLILLRHQRPRADEAHFPGQDVEELRDLVQRSLSQQSADAGYPRIVGDFEESVGLVALAQFGLM